VGGEGAVLLCSQRAQWPNAQSRGLFIFDTRPLPQGYSAVSSPPPCPPLRLTFPVWLGSVLLRAILPRQEALRAFLGRDGSKEGRAYAGRVAAKLGEYQSFVARLGERAAPRGHRRVPRHCRGAPAPSGLRGSICARCAVQSIDISFVFVGQGALSVVRNRLPRRGHIGSVLRSSEDFNP
jgi:hypothetical protein